MGPGNAKISPLPAGFTLKQTRFADDLHMTRNRRLGHFQNVRQLADAQRPIAHQADNPPACLVGQRTKKCIGLTHDEYYRHDISRFVEFKITFQNKILIQFRSSFLRAIKKPNGFPSGFTEGME
jgi:hypothetical protein